MTPQIFKDFVARIPIEEIQDKLANDPNYAIGINQLCELGDGPNGTEEQESVLHLLARSNQLSDVPYLKKFINAISNYTIDPTIANRGNMSAFLMALCQHNIFAIRLFTKAGFDLSIPLSQADNRNAIEYCRGAGWPKLAEALEHPNEKLWDEALIEKSLIYFKRLQRDNAYDDTERAIPSLEDIQLKLGIYEVPDIIFGKLVDLVKEGKQTEAINEALSFANKSPFYKDMPYKLALYYDDQNDLSHAFDLYQQIDETSPHFKIANQRCLEIINGALTEVELEPEEKRKYHEFQFKFAVQSAESCNVIDKLYHTLCGGTGLKPDISNVSADPLDSLIKMARLMKQLRDENLELKSQLSQMKATTSTMTISSSGGNTFFDKKGEQESQEEEKKSIKPN